MKKTLLALLIAAPFAASAADLVVNGSFEANAQANGTWGIYNNLIGWAGAPNIELRDNVAGAAFDGRNFVELDTYSNSAMSQLLVGTAGQYELSFWYSARPNVAAGSNNLTVSLDGGAPVTVLANTAGGNAHAWQHYSALVSFDGNALLTFSAAGRSDGLGGSLDKVSFISAPVPEPQTYALLLGGLGVLGFVARRRKAD